MTEKPADELRPLTVTCDICGMDTKVINENWFTRCKNEKCFSFDRLLLTKLPPNKRYIRMICQSVIKYNWVLLSKTTHLCDCKREHTITDFVAEIRCNQPVYKAELSVRIHEELNQIKEKCQKSEDEVETLRNRVKELEEEKTARDNKELDRLQKIVEERESTVLSAIISASVHVCPVLIFVAGLWFQYNNNKY